MIAIAPCFVAIEACDQFLTRIFNLPLHGCAISTPLWQWSDEASVL